MPYLLYEFFNKILHNEKGQLVHESNNNGFYKKNFSGLMGHFGHESGISS